MVATTNIGGTMTLTLEYRRPYVNNPVEQHERVDEIDDLRRLYDEYGPQVYRFCSRTLPPHLAEETTQDVFVRAWQHRDRYQSQRGSVLAWLIGIAKNRVIDIARAEQRHSTRRAELAEEVGHDTDTKRLAVVDEVADRVLIGDALRQLPPRQRQAVYLAYIEGRSHHEIADETGEPLGTVKSDIRRGIASIRARLEAQHD